MRLSWAADCREHTGLRCIGMQWGQMLCTRGWMVRHEGVLIDSVQVRGWGRQHWIACWTILIVSGERCCFIVIAIGVSPRAFLLRTLKSNQKKHVEEETRNTIARSRWTRHFRCFRDEKIRARFPWRWYRYSGEFRISGRTLTFDVDR